MGKLVHTQILPMVKMVDIARWVCKACLNWGGATLSETFKKKNMEI